VGRLWVRLGSGRTARRPVRYANQLPAQIESPIVALTVTDHASRYLLLCEAP
jgi:hypothetical protein